MTASRHARGGSFLPLPEGANDRTHPESGFVPRARLRPEALSYRVLRPAAAQGSEDFFLVAEAYRCWSEVWHRTLYELDRVKSVPSDEFTRQEEIGALFHDEECIGLTSWRSMDLRNTVFRDDSYFAVWPPAALDAVRVHGPVACTCGNLTVAAPWRRAEGGSVKELLLTLAVERFLLSDGDVLLGTPRNDRGMNALGYRLGFQPLVRDVVLHGVEVDLVAFVRHQSTRQPLAPASEAIVQRLRASLL